MTLYFEISPLQETEFTGVSVVTERLADAFIRKLGSSARFFLHDKIAPTEIVQEVIALRSGAHLRSWMAVAPNNYAPASADAFSYGLFPNKKTQWDVFSVEAQIVHDLSTVLTPEFHRPATVAEHAGAYRREIWSNTTTFCVSQATANDCALYFDVARRTRLQVIVEGCDWNKHFEPLAEKHAYTGDKPYILVLATLEPRKNIDVLLAALTARPALMDRFDFLFVGRAGWGEAVAEKLSRFGLEGRVGDSLHFPGFVTEFAKYALIKQAHLVIYPSIFEGFGLPVLEALSLGRHVLSSMSSSLMEVGGDACVYFDPNFPEQFAARLDLALARVDAQSVNTAGLERAALFSWDQAAQTILNDYHHHATAAYA